MGLMSKGDVPCVKHTSRAREIGRQRQTTRTSERAAALVGLYRVENFQLPPRCFLRAAAHVRLSAFVKGKLGDRTATAAVSVSHVLVGRGAERGPLLADFFGGQGAGEDVSPERQRGVEQRGGPARLRPILGGPGAVGEVVEVRNEEHHRLAVVQVPELVPPLRQPARVLTVLPTSD